MESEVRNYYKRKNILTLATLMASAAYAAGFNPPGDVWQDTTGHLPGDLSGDPIMRSTDYLRYLVFFYFNAAVFALSLMVVVLTLVLITWRPKKIGPRFDWPLWLLTVTAMSAFIVAYGTGACRDKFTVVVFSVIVCIVGLNIMCLPLSIFFENSLLQDDDDDDDDDGDNQKYMRKIIAPLSMFSLTISYVGGLNTPGGFWDTAEGGHLPGDTILHSKLLHLFFYFNTVQLFSSLNGVFIVMFSTLPVSVAVISMTTGLLGLPVAYTVGSSRGRHTTVSVICSLYAAVGAYVMLHVAVRVHFSSVFDKVGGCFSSFREKVDGTGTSTSSTSNDGNDSRIQEAIAEKVDGTGISSTSNDDGTDSRIQEAIVEKQRRRASSLVQLLAGLAVSITYSAGMYPPGGVWQDGDKAGDPVLQTTNPGRYKAFFYCNSVAFVASLLAIFLGQKRYLIKYHALQAAMILDLLSLVVAYAIGSCRDPISSMYAVGIAFAAVVYVVVHVQYFTMGSSSTDKDEDDADKKGGRFLLFAILVASITYQAGLTPPGGFLQSGHGVGHPVLLYNYPLRYQIFFYCNSVSFMVSTVLILLLVNPSVYRPAIRSHALPLCSAVSFLGLIGAFAAGGTQHLKTTIYIFVLSAVAFLCLSLLTIYYYWPSGRASPERRRPGPGLPPSEPVRTTDERSRKIYLMTLAILVGSVTYQTGLDPPGGSWQSTSDGHTAGHPVMHDSRRNRYLVFLCGNTTSFVASIYLIELLLFSMSFPDAECLKKAIEPTVVAQYVGFLLAYSNRQWKTSAHVGTLVIAVLVYVVATHVMLSYYCGRNRTHKK